MCWGREKGGVVVKKLKYTHTHPPPGHFKWKFIAVTPDGDARASAAHNRGRETKKKHIPQTK